MTEYTPPLCTNCGHNLEGPNFTTGKCDMCGHVDEEIADFFDEEAARKYEEENKEEVERSRQLIKLIVVVESQKSPHQN